MIFELIALNCTILSHRCNAGIELIGTQIKWSIFILLPLPLITKTTEMQDGINVICQGNIQSIPMVITKSVDIV